MKDKELRKILIEAGIIYGNRIRTTIRQDHLAKIELDKLDKLLALDNSALKSLSERKERDDITELKAELNALKELLGVKDVPEKKGLKKGKKVVYIGGVKWSANFHEYRREKLRQIGIPMAPIV